MLQKIIGYGLIGCGIYLFTKDQVFIGIVLVIIGTGISNGANHDTWICYHFDNDGSDCGGDGGGD